MYKVKLSSFEGPFDLLVYLIESARMSIYDIRISEITSEYLAVLKELEENDIAVSEEFMVLAASLIEIKSKMILPRTNELGDTVLEEDPRDELVSRILEYRRYKKMAEFLKEKEDENQRIFEKPEEDISVYTDNPDEYLSLDLGEFSRAFNLFISKKQRVESVRKHYTKIEREKARMVDRIKLILSRVRENMDRVHYFRDMVPNRKDKYDTVVSFMSVLEMAKENVINVKQERNFADIEISLGDAENLDKVLSKYDGTEGGNDEQ